MKTDCVNKLITKACIICSIFLCSCGTKRTTAYSSIKTSCIATELDGSFTLRIEGRGRNAVDAYKDAGKQAVYDILFTSIPCKNGMTKTIHPVFVGMRCSYEKNEAYFNTFFADGGEYEKYVSMKEKRELTSIYQRTNAQTACVTTVCVFRDKLREKMIQDGILE